MSGRIDRRRGFAGTGMKTDHEFVSELEERRALHDRLTRGKPERSFGDILDEKMHGKPTPEEPEEEPEKGAKEPHVGLSPGQSPSLAQGKGRAARVIVKG